MAAYYKVDVSLNTSSVTVGSPSAQEVLVTLPLVGPAGATGATGASGASTWNEISGKPATFPPSAHEHQPDQVYADAAFVSQSGDSSLQIGIYLHNGTDNGRPVYESPTTGDYIWWDSNLDQWYLTSNTDVNLYYLDENADEFPWETDVVWNAIPPQTGNIEVDQAFLSDISDYGVASVIGLKTSKSGNASSTELVLGSDTRLTNSRTPSSTLAHAASHHTGGSDALTPANIGAAPAVNVIELEADGTTTITTAQLPARGIAYAPEGESTYTVNLPTPDIRQSGLTFSLKTEYEEGSGTVFVTVVHAAVNLLTSYELDEDEGSIDFLWDGYAWTYDTAYRLRSFPSRVLQLPAASGTIARTEDFAAPPAIGSTTPNTGAFTTLTANNGTLTASAPVLDLAQTWNNSGTTFTGLLANFTNTASGSASKALDIKIGGTSVIETNGIGKTTVRLLGAATFNLSAFEVFREGSLLFRVRDDGQTISSKFIIGTSVFMTSSGIKYGSSQVLAWGSGTANDTSDLVLLRDDADTLAQRRTTNPQTFRIYTTYGGTGGADFERLFIKGQTGGAFQIGTEKGGTGSARALEFQTNGTTRLTVGTTGNVGIGTTSPTEKLTVFNDTKSVITSQFASNQCLVFGGDTVVGPYTASHTDGNGNSFGNFVGVRQRFGVAGFIIDTSPATSVGVARSWTERLRVEPANGNVGIGTTSPTAKLHVVGTVLVGGTLTFSDANNIAVGTTTGTKIGTATTQKLGFFNATPVVQQAAVADATDAATAITQLNDLLAAMRTLGLIAT
jgi:hypothetical protein